LLQRPPVRAEVVGIGREPGGRQRVDRGPAQRWRADHQQHLFRGEQHDPQRPAERRGPPADPVDPDPLPAAATAADAAGSGALDSDLEDIATDPSFDAGEVASPADELAVGRGAMRAAPAEQGDRLEETGLAGRVGTPDEVRTGTEVDRERRVAAQIEDRQGVERGDARKSS
jgi:hypothetical protein